MPKARLVTLLFALGAALVAASAYFPSLAPYATALALLMRSPLAAALARSAGVEVPVTFDLEAQAPQPKGEDHE